jgi:DNA repair exonuclease SbcCD ATPase subunit
MVDVLKVLDPEKFGGWLDTLEQTGKRLDKLEQWDERLDAISASWEKLKQRIAMLEDNLHTVDKRSAFTEAGSSGYIERLIRVEQSLLAESERIGKLWVDVFARIEAVWERLRKIEIPSKFSRQPEPAKGEVTGDRVVWLLGHIKDQVDKDQYINALSWTAELTAELVRRFNAVLKGDRP